MDFDCCSLVCRDGHKGGSRRQNKMAATHPRGMMVGLLVFLSVTLLLIGIARAEYPNKIYIDEYCNDNATTDGYLAGEVLLTRGKGCASQQCDCSFGLTHNDTSKRLKVRFTNLDLGKGSNECLGTLKIYSINGDKKVDKTSAMCTYPVTGSSEVKADMNVLYFDVNLGSYKTPNFSMFFTVFHEDACNIKDEFQCFDHPNPCVSNTLKCDGYDNCGDKSDEGKDTAGCVNGAIGVTSSTYQSVITLAAILLLKLVL